jgi:NAD(P)-dependent dehydrogenase (short-subunit alcohol dehydrogenase family)
MKTMLVTGAGNGIGRAIAQTADTAGYRVGLLDTDVDATQQAAAGLSNAVVLHADVRASDQVEQALDVLGTVDVVVNNAGILRTGPLIEHDPDDFRLVMDVNLNAVFVVAQAAARRMRDRKDGTNGGVIINMASINGIHPSPNCGAYVAAKAGVMALTQQMSIEWGSYGIRVNAIAPGFIDAGMSSPFLADEEVRTRRANGVPLGRIGTAEDVANAALFLASDEAAYITGQTLTVDGGVINSVLLQLPRD